MDGLTTIVKVDDPKKFRGLFMDAENSKLVVDMNGFDSTLVPWSKRGPQTRGLIESLNRDVPEGLPYDEARLLAMGLYIQGSHPRTASRVFSEVVDRSDLDTELGRTTESVGRELRSMYVQDLVLYDQISESD